MSDTPETPVPPTPAPAPIPAAPLRAPLTPPTGLRPPGAASLRPPVPAAPGAVPPPPSAGLRPPVPGAAAPAAPFPAAATAAAKLPDRPAFVSPMPVIEDSDSALPAWMPIVAGFAAAVAVAFAVLLFLKR